MKNPLTLAGIEPATIRFVTQHLNHCRPCYLVPKVIHIQSLRSHIYVYVHTHTRARAHSSQYTDDGRAKEI